MDRQWSQHYDRTYRKQSAPQRDYIKQSHDFVVISNLPFFMVTRFNHMTTDFIPMRYLSYG